jgi:hypothetical protein
LATRRKAEWKTLLDARSQLCVTFGVYFELTVDEALAYAISSGRVPFRGVRWLKILSAPIDGQIIREPTGSDICLNRLYLKTSSPTQGDPDFHSVRVEWNALERFVRENFVEVSGPPPRPGRGAIIRALRESVKRYQEYGKRPSRAEHIAELRQECPGMTEDQYDQLKPEIVPPEWSKAGRPRKSGKTGC